MTAEIALAASAIGADMDRKSMLAGAAATRAMTDVMNAAPRLGLAKVDIASMLGSIFNGGKSAAPRTRPWFAGMAIHYLLGTAVFPLIYRAVARRLLPGRGLAKSLEWSIGLWAGGQFVIMPLLRKYRYFQHEPDAKLTYLLGHLVYGSAFAAVAGKKAA
jgi:hypothetical protein